MPRIHAKVSVVASNSTQAKPHSIFTLTPLNEAFPPGWIALTITNAQLRKTEHALLEIHRPNAVTPPQTLALNASRAGKISSIFRIDHTNSHLVLRMLDASLSLTSNDIHLRPIHRAEAATRRLAPRIWHILGDPKAMKKISKTVFSLVTRGDLQVLFARIKDEFRKSDDYAQWTTANDTLADQDREAIRKRVAAMSSPPLISVVMPVYNVAEPWLRAAIESVRAQLYPHWELCIADDHSSAPHIRIVLEEFQKLDPRIKVIFRGKNGHISEASNSALELARGEFIALLDHDDALAEHALYCVAEEIASHPDADLIYSDEDKIDSTGKRFDPHFKPDWNPGLLLSLNLVTHLAVFRASVVRAIGGFRKGFEGSQDYDLLLRFTEHMPHSKIRHIPHVLYHWRAIEGSVALAPDQKNYAHDAARRAIQEHLGRMCVSGKALPGFGSYHRVQYALPQTPPLVSLIVCTRDRVELLKTIVEGILHETDYPSLEVLIVNNQSREPRTLEYFRQVRQDARVRVLDFDAPFNFSAMNNLGAREAKGAHLAFINNDLKVISPDWLGEMVSHAIQPGVGAVGALLYFPNETVQHAGIVTGIGGTAGHPHKGMSRIASGYVGRAKVIHDLSGVTGACMVVPKTVFEEVGGFDEEHLPVAFNDVDLSLKIRAKGYRIVFTPYAELYHFESATRGSDETPENKPRFNREAAFLRAKWGETLLNDPNYNPNLTLDREDFSLAFPSRARKPWH